jgi:heptosyltransferase-2
MQTALSDIRPVIHIPSKPWKKNFMPRRVLAIRLQAMGDLVITLPYLQHLKKTLPSSSELDLLTRKEVDAIPKNIQLFDHVYSIGGSRNVKKQLLHTCWLLPKLLLKRYDVVIDLQNNKISRLVRRILMPEAWSSFDRFSPAAAGERTRMAIEAVGLGKNAISSGFRFMDHVDPFTILKNNGWDGKSKLVVLNPAGAFPTRNWPLENYIAFATLWLQRFPDSQFLLLGTSFIGSKAAYLKEKLGERMINIINKTTPAEAFAILQHVKLMLSEDSGLMHMAWVSGVPTIALFGSTRSDWSRPLGEHSFFLESSDLPCGNCMQEICRYGDNHCLTRYTAEFVLEKAVGITR